MAFLKPRGGERATIKHTKLISRRDINRIRDFSPSCEQIRFFFFLFLRYYYLPRAYAHRWIAATCGPSWNMGATERKRYTVIPYTMIRRLCFSSRRPRACTRSYASGLLSFGMYIWLRRGDDLSTRLSIIRKFLQGNLRKHEYMQKASHTLSWYLWRQIPDYRDCSSYISS